VSQARWSRLWTLKYSRCRRGKRMIQRAIVVNVSCCDRKVTSMRSGCVSLDHIQMPFARWGTLPLFIPLSHQSTRTLLGYEVRSKRSRKDERDIRPQTSQGNYAVRKLGHWPLHWISMVVHTYFVRRIEHPLFPVV
jgi:hypothetical protein